MEVEYPRGLRHRCIRCAVCCRDTSKRERTILLTESEAAQIASHTGLKADDFSEHTRGAEPYAREMRKVDGRCVFLRGEGCSIYAVRPLICRFFPFYLERLDGDRFVFGVSKECPGVGMGARLDRRFFYDLLRKAITTRGESTLPI